MPPRLSYYAHSDAGDQVGWHRLSEHLVETGARAAELLEPAECANLAKAAGLLHDLGKYSREFQARLAGGPHCDHSTAGAKIAIERYGEGDARKCSTGKMLAYAIAGHHAGLADGVNGKSSPRALADRLQTPIPKLDPIWEWEIALPADRDLMQHGLKPRDSESWGFCAAFATRMIFSALVDADYLDTEAWYAQREGYPKARGGHPPLSELLARLESYLNTKGYLDARASIAGDTEVNRLRREVLAHVRSKAAETPGLFTLTVPTGGGKTLSSLAFALEHAVRHGLARVIYVIPYTSIIDQTANVFREALGADCEDTAAFIVEHHSAFEEERVRERELGTSCVLPWRTGMLRSLSPLRSNFSRACSPTDHRDAASCTISLAAP